MKDFPPFYYNYLPWLLTLCNVPTYDYELCAIFSTRGEY